MESEGESILHQCVYMFLFYMYICMYVCVVHLSGSSGTHTTSRSRKGTLLYLISQLPVNDCLIIGSCKTSSTVSQPSVSAGEAESEGECVRVCMCMYTYVCVKCFSLLKWLIRKTHNLILEERYLALAVS